MSIKIKLRVSWMRMYLGIAATTAVYGLMATEASATPCNVSISTAATTNMAYSSSGTLGTYTPSDSPANLSVTDLTTKLGTINVKVSNSTSSTGCGNITVSNAFNWSSHTLTLDAYNSTNIDATVHAEGTAGVTLTGSGTQLTFNGGRIRFQHTTQALSIGGNSYTLVAGVSGLNSSVGSGYVALMDNDDETGTTYSPSAVTTTVEATVEGLGNTMSNVTVSNSSPATNTSAGVFEEVDSSGSIRDLNIASSTVSSALDSSSSCNAQVGGLAAINLGSLTNDSFVNTGSGPPVLLSSGDCREGGSALVGGLVGKDQGNITNSYANTTVGSTVLRSYIGGLAGYVVNNSAVTNTITNCYSQGEVEGNESGMGGGNDFIGGLIGQDVGVTVMGSYSNSTVIDAESYAGGLIGWINDTDGGTSPYVLNSYATGSVTENVGASDVYAGGLIALNSGANIGGLVGGAYYTAYATGDVTVPAYSSFAGGLVAENSPDADHSNAGGNIAYSYATGSVSEGSNAAGLVSENSGTIDQSFSTGSVTSSEVLAIGGLVGANSGTVTDSYSLGDIDNEIQHSTTGGLVGNNSNGSTNAIATSFAIGGITVTGTPVTSCSTWGTGGVVGLDTNTTDVTNAYFQSPPTGSLAGRGCPTGDSGITAESASYFTSQIPGGFDTSIWGWSSSGLYCSLPYLIHNLPPYSCDMKSGIRHFTKPKAKSVSLHK